MSENAKKKIVVLCSYIGNQHLVAGIGGPKSGLRVGSLDDGGCTSVDIGHCSPIRPGFVSHIPGKQFILDFQNSTIRLPAVIENTEGPLYGSDFRGNEMVMDFQNSRVYMLSEKGDVTNIATLSGFMAAFSGCSDIMLGIVSTEGCQCSFSTLETVATEGHRSSMTSGHQKEQEKVRPSIAKGSSHEVEIPLNSAKTKKKHSKFGGLRGKRLTSAS
ncbi:hypothetical protein Tco_0949831 [Tanacetum coccineum]